MLGSHNLAISSAAVYGNSLDTTDWTAGDPGDLQTLHTNIGVISDRETPSLVHNLNNIIDINFGYYHTCALLNNGSVSCWGRNIFGQLGDETATTRDTPVLVHDLSNVVDFDCLYEVAT